MEISLSGLEGYDVVAVDGGVGKVLDVYFDDQDWVVRYFVVDPRDLDRQGALVVSPIAVTAIDHETKSVMVDLTRERLERSPGLELHEPVSTQMEREYYRYYGWQFYWEGQSLWGRLWTPAGLAAVPSPAVAPGPLDAWTERIDELDPRTGRVVAADEHRQSPGPERQGPDRHLRSVVAVSGYHVRAEDGEIGHVIDFLADPESWQISCLAVDTSNWWFGKKAVLGRGHVTGIDWAQSIVAVDMTKDEVKAGPEYDSSAPDCTNG